MQITQDRNKIKKNPEQPFVDAGKCETCKISVKDIQLYFSWSSSKFSVFENFWGKVPGCLKLIELGLKFLWDFELPN